MCAATTTFMALLDEGSHLIVTSDCYRRTRQFIEQFLSRMGVETTVIEPSNLEAFREAIRPNTKLFFTESPTNPYLRVIDVPAFADVAHAATVSATHTAESAAVATRPRPAAVAAVRPQRLQP